MNWKAVMHTYPEFERQIIIYCHDQYDKEIQRPIMAKKQGHIDRLRKRSDGAVLVLDAKGTEIKDRNEMF